MLFDVGRTGRQTPTKTRAMTNAGVYTSPSLDLNFMVSSTLDPRVTFTRTSAATYFDATGTMQTAATGVARFDYDPVTHAALGLMIEGNATNVLLNSATLGTQSVTVTAQAYTLSFYGTGTITKSGTATGVLVGVGAFPQRVSQTFTPTAGTLTLTVTGSVLNAQLEAGTFPTSYIPTFGTTATRVNDAAYIVITPLVNANAGTTSQDWDGLNSSTVQQGMSDTTFNNSLYVSQNGCNAFIGGVQTGLTTNVPLYTGALNKTAVAYGNLRLAASINGAIGSTALVSGPYPWTTWLSIGCSPWVLDSQIGGHVRRVQYWPRALSNTELQQITT